MPSSATTTSSDEQRWRTAVHEAGHAVVDVLSFGADGVVASTMGTDRRLGMSMRTATLAFDGTTTAYRLPIEILLAGRAAEEVPIGEAS